MPPLWLLSTPARIADRPSIRTASAIAAVGYLMIAQADNSRVRMDHCETRSLISRQRLHISAHAPTSLLSHAADRRKCCQSKIGSIHPWQAIRGMSKIAREELLGHNPHDLLGGDAPEPEQTSPHPIGQGPNQEVKPSLRLRGGGKHVEAFYDLDGTLYDGTMAHCAWWFCVALPNPFQRISKAVQIVALLPAIGIAAAYDEAIAAHMLAYITVSGVAEKDAEVASRAVTAGVARRGYKAVFQHIKAQQDQGKRTAILSGNIVPMIQDLADQLSCDVIATEMEVVDGYFTGRRTSKVCVKKAKRARMLEALPEAVKAAGPKIKVVGVGNSMADAPFLELVAAAAVVRPSGRLKRLAQRSSWDISMATVRAEQIQLPEKLTDKQELRSDGMSGPRHQLRSLFSSLELSTLIAWGATIMFAAWLHKPKTS